ncbi:hypothetical protein B0H16DRAFT_1691660 [Mycena metata]|uniref:Uncharacterized protein n=1 Tax=Mycena metata TaxID=1033252 RepID=A0AAD7IVT9_9AGAR|nr:hypothetical protein B0H16DRAFT_1691660 [Mycena metata]
MFESPSKFPWRTSLRQTNTSWNKGEPKLLITRPTMSSNPAWEVEALEHVKKMLKYIEAHSISSLFLAKDPTQCDALAKELRESTDPRVRHGLAAEPGEDVSSSLSAWDAALEQAATTFPEHFCQLHFAAIATIYYEQYVLAPAYQETFHNFYLEKFYAGSSLIVSHLTGADPDPLHGLNGVNGKTTHRNPPPADFLTLDLQTVQVILLPLTRVFCLFSSITATRRTRTGSVIFGTSNKITSRGTKCVFEIVPEVGESWEESKEGVIAMLLESCACPSS